MQLGDRLICVLLGNQLAGDMFTDWPLHITIIPWFRTPITGIVLSEQIDRSIRPVASFTLSVEGEAGFGYKGRKLVNLIAQPSPLDIIENKVRSILHRHKAWIVDETNNFQRQFRPHITENKSGRAHEGETYVCDALYIVEQKGDYKEITSRILL